MNSRSAIVSTRFPRMLWVSAGITAGIVAWWLTGFDLPYPRTFILIAAAVALVGALLVCRYTRLPKPEIAATIVGYYAALQALVFAFFSLLAIVSSVRPLGVSLQLAWQSFGLSLAALILAGSVLVSGAGHRQQLIAMVAPVLALARLVLIVMAVRLVLYLLMQVAL